jgi:phenylalanyl-tRNA synthetase beta chain
MRISYDWLKDYVDIDIAPEGLAQTLTMAGLSVDSIEKKNDDFILEIEITSNRPDWLSYIGVAREVAAITGKKLKKVGSRQSVAGSKKNVYGKIAIKVEDKKLCPRYTARIITGVKVGESPEWLKRKIESIGLRSVNNIVDITNFCLFETGEPMHAFDLDTLSGNALIVRKAAKNEKITVIDGTQRALDESMLVIADSVAPVAVAGVMGGIKTEVGLSTKNILLEAAYFDPVSVRRTSRKLALSSESSYRFERKVNIESIRQASDRATQLVLETAGGCAGNFVDMGASKAENRKIALNPVRLNKILGAGIPAAKIAGILNALGLKTLARSKSGMKFEAPAFRQDLREEIDLIEEVARIYGYDNIGATLPGITQITQTLPPALFIDSKTRETLKSLGLSEIITYSLLSKKTLSLAKIDDKDAAAIKNPLSAEQEILRPSSIPGMLGAMRYNINRKNCDLRLYELGKVYFKTGAQGFVERRNMTIALTGEMNYGWISGNRPVNLFDLKGYLETLFSVLGIDDFTTRQAQDPRFLSSTCASIEVAGAPLGILGEIDHNVLKNFDIKCKVYALELDCEALLGAVSLKKRFREPARYPSAVRDISIVINNNASNADIIDSIKESAGTLLKNVQLVDKYRGGQIPDGKQSLTYRLEYQDAQKTLEDKEVQEAHSRVVRALEEKLGASLR